MLEAITDIRNVQKAFKQVTANKGVGGIDGMQTDELRDYLNAHWQTLRKDILEGNYKVQAVRKVTIPKPQGGTRMLGIPTVADRLLQQAIAQWLSPKYEEEFPITVTDLEQAGMPIRHYCKPNRTSMKGMNG